MRKQKTAPITDLAHPTSMRLNPGRPCFVTEAGIDRRVSEGRGLGEGPDYVPWLCCTDFSSAGYRRMVYSPRLGRIVHLLSELEWKAFLIAEFTDCVIDIRENYPLDRTRTREIAKQLEVNHPAPYADDVVMTTDLFLTIKTPFGPRNVAWYIKYARSLWKPRTQELLKLEREYHRSNQVRLLEITEQSFPRALTDNLKFVRGALRSPHWLESKRVDLVEEELRPKASRERLDEVCEQSDKRFGLSVGTSLFLARHFIATHRWKVNMFRPILAHAPLQWEAAA